MYGKIIVYIWRRLWLMDGICPCVRDAVSLVMLPTGREKKKSPVQKFYTCFRHNSFVFVKIFLDENSRL